MRRASSAQRVRPALHRAQAGAALRVQRVGWRKRCKAGEVVGQPSGRRITALGLDVSEGP